MFDPALLLWDADDYEVRKGQYWSLAGELMTLFDVLEDETYDLVLTPLVAQEIIGAFPSEQIIADTELHDFVNAVYLFLANRAEFDFPLTDNVQSGCLPDIAGRAFFPVVVQAELRAILSMLFAAPPPRHIVSSLLFWNSNEKVAVEASAPNNELLAWLCEDDYIELRTRLRRIYEKHDKHDAKSGYGSRLPTGVSESEIQSALDGAIELNGQNCLVARIEGEAVLIFRRHEKNKYHAYPIEPNEYSKYSINPSIFSIE